MAPGRRGNTIKHEWVLGIQSILLAAAGHSTKTGGAEEAARLFSEMSWSENTWSTHACQVAKWLRFCDEDIRKPLLANDGDLLAYVGFLSLDGTISPEFLPQYLSAVSKYHELHHFSSHTRTPLVRALVLAYKRKFETYAEPKIISIGCPAHIMCSVMEFGLHCEDELHLTYCAILTMAFIIQVQYVSVAHVHSPSNIGEVALIWVKLTYELSNPIKR